MQAKLDEIWMAALTVGIAVAAGYGWLSAGATDRTSPPAVATSVAPAAIAPAAAAVVLENAAGGEPAPVYRLPAIVVTGKRAQTENPKTTAKLARSDFAGRSEQSKPTPARGGNTSQAAAHPVGWSCATADQPSRL